VRFPRGVAVRPTADRVRETLFNWLGQDLTGWSTLDLFAGSGALTLEALSRGAALAVAVDRAPRSRRARRRRPGRSAPKASSAHGRCAACLPRETRRFDAIFLDPPFADDPWAWLLPACAARSRPRIRLRGGGRADRPPRGLPCTAQAARGRCIIICCASPPPRLEGP
jgi:16S rRNA (guanine966-N2)-methyltransferase